MAHKVVAEVFVTAHVYKRENEILRGMLRERGLSNATIQRMLKSRMKDREAEDSALLLMTQVCQEALKRFPLIDLEAELAKAPPTGPVH